MNRGDLTFCDAKPVLTMPLTIIEHKPILSSDINFTG